MLETTTIVKAPVLAPYKRDNLWFVTRWYRRYTRCM